MGGNESKQPPARTRASHPHPTSHKTALDITPSECSGLRASFSKLKPKESAICKFKLHQFDKIASADVLLTRLVEQFEHVVNHKIVSTNGIEISAEEYELTFASLCKATPSKRISFYYSMFPSVDMFFSAAITLSGIPVNEEETSFLLKGFKYWITLEEDHHSSSFYDISNDPQKKEERILQIVIESRIQRLICVFDSWMYGSFINSPTATQSLAGLAIVNDDTNRCIRPFHSASCRWMLSLFCCPQLDFSDPERSSLNQIASKPFLFDFTSSGKTNNHGDFVNTFDLIYSAVRDGSGMNRLVHAVFGYPACSFVVIHTQEDEVFGGFLSSPWPRNLKKYFGDEYCFLFSLAPELAVYPSRGLTQNFVKFLDKSRKADLAGLSFGGQMNHERLWIDGDDFGKGRKTEMCSTYFKGPLGLAIESEFVVRDFQVWGLGGEVAREYQKDVRNREEIFAERSRKVDAASFFGEGQSNMENADTVIMEWMGANKSHGHRAADN